MSKKILVADDSVVIQKSIGISFAQEDFQVTFVGNGEEALQRAKEVKPDLILADTSMPKLSGAELCKKFRQDSDFRRTPILLLASNNETFNPGQLKACGANDFIQKPFESSALVEKVKLLFSQKPEVTSAEAKASMEQSIDQVFSKAPTLPPEEVTAIGIPPSKPLDAIELEKSDDFGPDLMGSFGGANPTPSPNTLASLDVLSMDVSEELGGDSVEFEEEKTKTVAPDAIFKVQSDTPPPAATPQPEPQLSLNDQQIEQIVSKVFKNVIERIAWEVVPEMAERIIKEELQKITSDK